MAAQINFAIFFVVVVVVVEGYYYGDYYPEEQKFKKRKGDDGYSPMYVSQEVNRPDKWLRLKQRSEDLLEDYRRRGYNIPYRQQTTYRGYRNIPQSNVYNQVPDWQRYEPYTRYTQTHVKGPRLNSRQEEYVRQNGKIVYPQETVEETAQRFVNARPDYTDKQQRTRQKYRARQKKRRNNWKNRITEYLQPTRNRNNRQIYNPRTTQPTTRAVATGSYQGCRDSGMYCTFWKSIGCCEQELGRKYCRKSCGFCSPQQTICPSSYRYGCCYDGTEAMNREKSNCPDCLDKSRICRRWAIIKDCDLHVKNSLQTRRICPQTCGACFDYSTTR